MTDSSYSVYQEYLSKSLTEKYNNLSNQMDNVIHEANSELTALRTKIEGNIIVKQELNKVNNYY